MKKWVFFFFCRYFLCLNNMQINCLFSFFYVLFPVLAIRTLACLILQVYCTSVCVAVIWFIFRLFFVSVCFWSRCSLSHDKIHHAISATINWFQPCRPKNYIYIQQSNGFFIRHIANAFLQIIL